VSSAFDLRPKNRYGAKAVKVREIIRLIETDGWYLVRMRGSHRQYHHFGKPGTVTVAGSPSDDLPKKTQHSILKQAGLR
jgi:predicted RNA binding protein YcfA (HicA-like mRNA interferase family)